MPYRHGFLSKGLRDYLDKKKKSVGSKKRAWYDFHVRKSLIQSLSEAVFILKRIDKKQFDKVFKDVHKQINDLFSLLCKRSAERFREKLGKGRIKSHLQRIAFRSGSDTIDVVRDFAQNSLDNLFGKDVFYVHVLSKEANRDYEKWFADTKKNKVAWKKV